MSPVEKAQILQWIAQDLGGGSPGIESTPGVFNGDACIVRTRIPVWLLVHAKRLGSSEADLLVAYPTLRAEDLANAWAYYASHTAEIDRQIDEHEMSWVCSKSIEVILREENDSKLELRSAPPGGPLGAQLILNTPK